MVKDAARKTLKSHFNITKDDDEQPEEELPLTPPPVQYESEEVVDEEVPIKFQGRLRKADVMTRLSCLGKIATGDSYAYLKASLQGMNLTDINSIVNFKHLQFVDVSNNSLTIEKLQVLMDLPYLLLVHADQNNIYSGDLRRTKYLQVIIMNNNNITSCHNIYQPELSTLELGFNKLTKVNFENKLSKLKCLDVKYNMIQDLTDWELPNLVCLYLAGNKIKKLEGISKLTGLKILHLRANPIKKLDGFNESMKSLYYLNLRNCKVEKLKQVKKLKVLPALEVLIMKGTPYMGGTGVEEKDVVEEESDEVRVEMIASLPKIIRINKTPVSDEERAEAKELMIQWLEEGDKAEEEEEEEEMEAEQIEQDENEDA